MNHEPVRNAVDIEPEIKMSNGVSVHVSTLRNNGGVRLAAYSYPADMHFSLHMTFAEAAALAAALGEAGNKKGE